MLELAYVGSGEHDDLHSEPVEQRCRSAGARLPGVRLAAYAWRCSAVRLAADGTSAQDRRGIADGWPGVTSPVS